MTVSATGVNNGLMTPGFGAVNGIPMKGTQNVVMATIGRNVAPVSFQGTNYLGPLTYLKQPTFSVYAYSGLVPNGRVHLMLPNGHGKFEYDINVRLPFVNLVRSMGGTVDYTGKVGGNVQEETVNVQRKVRLYSREDGRFVGEYFSRLDGNFNFSGLDYTKEYIVMALDVTPAPEFNDLLFAKVLPLSAVTEDPEWLRDG